MRGWIATTTLLLPLWTACGGVSKIDFTSWGRDAWQRPDDVVSALAIQPGAVVADLGAGDGYFVPHLAEAAGPDGRVYAVEVEPEKVQELEERFADDANVEVVLGEYGDPLLPDGSVDVVLIVNTYHHIEDRTDYFARLRDDLAPRGRVAVIEPNAELGGVLGLTLDEGHKSAAADVEREMREAGYRRTESLDFLPVQIFEVFTPDGDAG